MNALRLVEVFTLFQRTLMRLTTDSTMRLGSRILKLPDQASYRSWASIDWRPQSQNARRVNTEDFNLVRGKDFRHGGKTLKNTFL